MVLVLQAATVCSVQEVAALALEVDKKHMDAVQVLREEQTLNHLVVVERSAVHCQSDHVGTAQS